MTWTPKEDKVVASWREFGHRFTIVALAKPDAKGRRFRLYDNGEPAYGGQWHHTVRSARARADYVLQGSYEGRIAWLEMRVNYLERLLRDTGGEA